MEMQEEGHAQCAIYSAPAQAGRWSIHITAGAPHIHSALFKAMQLLRTPVEAKGCLKVRISADDHGPLLSKAFITYNPIFCQNDRF